MVHRKITVVSSLSLGSLQAPIPLVRNIHDLNVNIGDVIYDPKVCNVDSKEASLGLQNYINQLARWAEKWKIEFTSEKMEIEHLR